MTGAAQPSPPLRGRGRGEGGVARPRPPGALVTSARSEQQAKGLRVAATFTERTLWKGLRALSIPGGHFRRQAPIGPYVADFVCLRARLIVELDGGVHALPEVAERDALRQAWLERQGFQVLRFGDKQVIDNLDAVLARIDSSVRSRTSPPPPAPSPQGGGGLGLEPIPSPQGGGERELTLIPVAQEGAEGSELPSPPLRGRGQGEGGDARLRRDDRNF